MYAAASYSQENKDSSDVLRTESNGVVVYKAQGVKGTVTYKVVEPVAHVSAPTFNELTLDELKDRLSHANDKLKKAEDDQNSQDIYRYRAAVNEVARRIEELEAQK